MTKQFFESWRKRIGETYKIKTQSDTFTKDNCNESKFNYIKFNDEYVEFEFQERFPDNLAKNSLVKKKYIFHRNQIISVKFKSN